MKGRKSNPREHGSRRWGAGSGCIAAVLPLLLVTWGSYLPAAAEQLVDAGSFRVAVPDSGEWDIAREQNRVLFRREHFSSGNRVGTTALLVLRTRPEESQCGLTPEQTAENYCNEEEFQLWLRGQIHGLFGVSDLDREIALVGGKEMYSMSYRLEFSEEYGGARTNNRMYIHFPRSFDTDNYFFVFMQTEACLPGYCEQESVPLDETPLRRLITSLQTPDDNL
ncbi:MAG: hypothetical protein PVI25_04675 [Gammaproteobacteria bacterium]|jgi:hypothetical protein|nr:MAG: hypothetical protein AMJ59_14295 [Gammaproteobacteria bacterium SG8_31]